MPGVELVKSGAGCLGAGGAEAVCSRFALCCPTGIGLVASVFVPAPFNLPFPKVQLESWKLGPSGPVPFLRYAHPSRYFHPPPAPSCFASPNVSITVMFRLLQGVGPGGAQQYSSIASSPLMSIALEAVAVGANPKNASNFSVSLLT